MICSSFFLSGKRTRDASGALAEYLQGIDVGTYLAETDQEVREKQELLESTKKEKARLQRLIDQWIDLRVAQELSKEQFAIKSRPAEEQLKQLDAQVPIPEAEIDVRNIQLLSSDSVMGDI